MKLTPLKLEGVFLLEPVVHGDHRGFLWRVIMKLY